MAVKNNYALEIDSIILCKFDALRSGIPITADKSTTLDITPQVHEINIYESLFSSILKCEIAVVDYIGLFVNFPLSGEEAIFIRYRTVKEGVLKTVQLVIDSVDHINVSDESRETAFIIKCVSIEAYANALQTIQKGYKDQTIPDIIKQVFEEFISDRMKNIFPSYTSPTLIIENTYNLPGTVIIPNRHPFSAISMLADMCVSGTNQRHTYLFFQTISAFNFTTLQSLFDFNGRGGKLRRALENKYIYNAAQPNTRTESPLYNEGRNVTNLTINRRHSTLQKLTTGYFQNKLFEINLAQKAIWAEETKVDDIITMRDNKLNTSSYINSAYVNEGEEEANRVKYILTAQKENDSSFPVSRYRDRWGKDIVAMTAMSQIDLTVTIPGTSMFSAGDLFYLEIPEMHGFNKVDEDDLISGTFLISEVKQMLHLGGFHTTVLRLNRDSYSTSIERGSRYE